MSLTRRYQVTKQAQEAPAPVEDSAKIGDDELRAYLSDNSKSYPGRDKLVHKLQLAGKTLTPEMVNRMIDNPHIRSQAEAAYREDGYASPSSGGGEEPAENLEIRNKQQTEEAKKKAIDSSQFFIVGQGGSSIAYDTNGYPSAGTVFVRKSDGDVFYLAEGALHPIRNRTTGKGLDGPQPGVMTDDEIEAFLQLVPHGKADAWEDFLSERGDVQTQMNQRDTQSRWYQKSMRTQRDEAAEAGERAFGPKGPSAEEAVRKHYLSQQGGVKESVLRKLSKLANELDLRGLNKEANYLDGVIRKMAEKRTSQLLPLSPAGDLDDALRRLEELEDDANKAVTSATEAAGEAIHKSVDPGNDALKAYLLDTSKSLPARDALLERFNVIEVFRGGGQAAADAADRLLAYGLHRSDIRDLILKAFVEDNGAMKLKQGKAFSDNLTKTAGGPGEIPFNASAGQELLYKTLQAFYDYVDNNNYRDYYSGDDETCAQEALLGALRAFDLGDYSPSFPEEILMAGSYAEKCATGLDSSAGYKSFFEGHLLEGVGRNAGAFGPTTGNGAAMHLWRAFKSENKRRYLQDIPQVEQE
jgi:hypothetical protein